MFTDLKLYDKVFSIRYGWGTVSRVDEDCLDELYYRYDSDIGENIIWFDVHGKLRKDDYYPSIFWDVPQVTIPKRPLPMDAPIWVRDSDNEDWVKRHFKAYSDLGEASAWNKGLTSFTVETPYDFSYWRQWKLSDEESKS